MHKYSVGLLKYSTDSTCRAAFEILIIHLGIQSDVGYYQILTFVYYTNIFTFQSWAIENLQKLENKQK